MRVVEAGSHSVAQASLELIAIISDSQVLGLHAWATIPRSTVSNRHCLSFGWFYVGLG